MNKKQLWQHFLSKNPHWKTENVTLTPTGIEKLFNTVYEQAHKQGVENGMAIAAQKTRTDKAKYRDSRQDDPIDRFSKLFGMDG